MRKLILIVSIGLMLNGCATSTKKLASISLGMDKENVIESIGDPDEVKGAMRNKFGQSIEVWEYTLVVPSSDTAGTIVSKSVLSVITLGIMAKKFQGKRKKYWFYYYQDELVRWGPSGVWSTESDRIYEIDFNPKNKLSPYGA
jgi:hypothetical protein